jgi:hypothetical protein
MFRSLLAVMIVTLAASAAHADHLLQPPYLPDDCPADVPPGLANLAHDHDALHHFAVVDAQREYSALTVVRFLRLHLARDPENPWRLLDTGIAEIHAASYHFDRKLSALGRARIEKGLARAADGDAAYLLVAAMALAEADWTDTRNKEKPSRGKQRAGELIRRACAANRAQPHRQFLRAFEQLARPLASWRGYAPAFAGDRLDCAGD